MALSPEHNVVEPDDPDYAMLALAPTGFSTNNFDNSALYYDDSNSDCFQQAISSIRTRCDGALVANTEERVKGTISWIHTEESA